jgi:hypothetical protein
VRPAKITLKLKSTLQRTRIEPGRIMFYGGSGLLVDLFGLVALGSGTGKMTDGTFTGILRIGYLRNTVWRLRNVYRSLC